MKLSELKKIIKEELKINEAPKIKANQKISKKEWRKIKSFNKHIGQDGTHYVMQLTNKGTALVPVVVEGNLKEGKLVKVPKDPVPPSAYKGPKKFNGLKDLKGEDKIAWLTWMGSHPQGKGSYEIDGKRLNVNGINPRDKGFYVSHFTQRTGIRNPSLTCSSVKRLLNSVRSSSPKNSSEQSLQKSAI